MSEFAGALLAGIIRYSLFIFEAAAVLLVVRLAWRGKSVNGRRLARLERIFTSLARRPALAMLATGLLALALRAALVPVLPVRQPLITDEFSYLLAADTFLSGRLANPPHPMWQHFESMHILVQPTYMSMYPPMQGLVLAAGRLLGGHPWVGVWLSTAAMCAAITWMLQGWLPPVWAFGGGLLAVARLGLFGYWANSYWGGAAAATGGALLLGALARIRRRARVRDALLLAAALAILANSRPYEGFLLAVPVGIALGGWLAARSGPPRSVRVLRVVAPAVLLLFTAAAAMRHYNESVTGDPFLMPHLLNRAQYAQAPYFIFQPPKPPPEYRHRSIRDFYAGWEMKHYLETQSVPGFVRNSARKLRDFWTFFLGPLLTLPLAMLPKVVRDRRTRFLVIAVAVSAGGLAINNWFYPHYAAPMTAALYGILMQGLRHLRAWKRQGFPAGTGVVRGAALVCGGILIVRLAAQPLSFYLPPDYPMTWFYTRPGNLARASVLAELSAKEGKQLAIVRYKADHNPLEEWVYNAADIDGSKVVWAQEMDAASSERLSRYFGERQVWLVEADEQPPKTSPYPRTQ